MADTQNFKNHARLVPAFHLGVFFTLLAYFVWSAYRMVQSPGVDTVMTLLVAAALIVMAFSLRGQVLRVQDRIIRLEMRLRLRELLPADLAGRAAALPVKQLVALRFACDDELADLVREVLDGRLNDPKDIKMRVKEWQGDFLRA